MEALWQQWAAGAAVISYDSAGRVKPVNTVWLDNRGKDTEHVYNANDDVIGPLDRRQG